MTQTIRHEFTISATAHRVFEALSEGLQIAGWWTDDCDAAPRAGTVSNFRWKGFGWSVRMAVQRLDPFDRVEWKCIQSNMQDTDAWTGTEIRFEISVLSAGRTLLRFTQTGYRESPCFDVCNDGWKFFLGTSLREYLEHGVGKPYRAPQIQKL